MPQFEISNYNKATTFKVALGEIEVADFTAVKGLRVTKEVLEYYEGGQNDHFHKLIGGTRHTPIELSYGSSSSTELYDWVKKSLDGNIERKNGSIMAIHQDGTVIARWEFRAAWPMRYEGPDFEHVQGGDQVAISKLVLAHSGFFMQKEGDTERRLQGSEQSGDGAGVSKGDDRGGSAGGLPGGRTRNVRKSCKENGVEVWDDDDAGKVLDDMATAQGKDPKDVQAASVGNVMIIRPEHSDDPSMMRQEQRHIQTGQQGSDDDLQQGEQQARDDAKEEDLTKEEQEKVDDEQARVNGDPGYHP